MSFTGFLEKHGDFDTKESLSDKLKLIKSLESIAKNWVISQSADQDLNLSPKDDQVFAAIYLQGSAVMGASTKSSDIDAVLVVPRFITTDAFFDSLTQELQRLPTLQTLIPVKGAWFPLIRLKISQIKIDLALCKLATNLVPRTIDFSTDPTVLYSNMEANSIQLLSGVHLSKELHTMVPDYEKFLLLLKAVKFWATRRRISDFIYGFPPSISWALLCVYICRQFVNLSQPFLDPMDESEKSKSLETLLKVFFTYYSNWNWPENPLIINTNTETLDRLSRAGKPLMSIISPVYPFINTTMSVRRGSYKVVVDELLRARDLLLVNCVTDDVPTSLYEACDIREHFKYFIKISLISNEEEELEFSAGLVNSRLRDLAQSLEENSMVSHTRIVSVPDRQENTFLNGLADEGETGLVVGDKRRRYKHWLIGIEVRKNTEQQQRKPKLDITPHLQFFYQQLRDRQSCQDKNIKMNLMFLKRESIKNLVL
ncbi:hypothetical protein Ciccas_004140 [Cichlidogyrus casuarinus]|uniref:polynucleotide adenylyltransferase n=1 Tax=Cichlidogyrus casuarinus TaxID=1844966 RepID=A0ABD2QCE9_9PLAT